ncbi:hypothetical protein KO516_20705 [Citreicella sp. C3M06]|uniref:hypothetical protein n=1 Tax=Citreicella sp. C3M06 TaxID=2841564 RepID=UPI001C099095|nr:hypothetical protein [Citreicella sp. C3M06]MBU2963199.1 hypothetical protein [Citreicella sp. C3M06]
MLADLRCPAGHTSFQWINDQPLKEKPRKTKSPAFPKGLSGSNIAVEMKFPGFAQQRHRKAEGGVTVHDRDPDWVLS